MTDAAATRRSNLAALCARRGWGPAELRDELEFGRYSYWRDLLENPAKSFGEKVARRIEEKLGLGPRWLDDDHASELRRYPRATEGGLHAPPPTPSPRFEDKREPSDSDWQMLRDVAVYPEEERRKLMAEVHAQAERWRAIERELTARAKASSKS